MTEKPAKTNIGSPATAFSLAHGQLVGGAIVGLATAVLLAAALSEYATATDLTMQSVQRPITLTEAIGILLANNPELAAARYDVDAAGAQHDMAVGARLPEIHLRGGGTRIIVPPGLSGQEGLALSKCWDLQINFLLEISF